MDLKFEDYLSKGIFPMTKSDQDVIDNRLAKDLTEKIQNKAIPRYIYKYRSVDECLKILKEQALYFAKPDELRDPFELRPLLKSKNPQGLMLEGVKGIKDMLTRMGFSIEGIFDDQPIPSPKECMRILGNYQYEILQNMGIFCATIDPTNILMWSYYANDHKGVCIKLDMFVQPDVFCPFNPCIYSDLYPVLDLNSSTEEYGEASYKMHNYKAKDWFYEREVRVVKSHVHGLFPINKTVVVEIIFGMRIDPQDEKKFKTAAYKLGYKIKFKKAVASDNQYKINIV